MLLNLLMSCVLDNLGWFIFRSVRARQVSGYETLSVSSDGVEVGYFITVELSRNQWPFQVHVPP